jgi:hypothetical protein
MYRQVPALRHALPFHNHALRELLEPARRDYHEARGAPRQIPFGSDSQASNRGPATAEPDIRC